MEHKSLTMEWYLIPAHVQRLTADQAEHQLFGIIRSLAYVGSALPQPPHPISRARESQSANVY
jgi:hypothetical protein